MIDKVRKVIIFVRVSTNIQEYERQERELRTLAVKNDWTVKAVFSEKVSGVKNSRERKGLQQMLEYVRTNKVDRVLVTELSRLGRNPLQVLEVIESLKDEGVSLYIQNYNIETLTAEGKVNPMSQFLVTILAEMARAEREHIRERVESGYNNYRANGGKVGRKEGYQKSAELMREQYVKELRLLRKGLSLREISQITGTSVNTIRKCQKLGLF